MDQKLPDSPALRRIEAAIAAGRMYLVDEDARPVSFRDVLDQRCWAHMRAEADEQFYVQELKGSRSLLRPAYQDVLTGIV